MKTLVIGSINKDIVFDVEEIVKEGQTINSSKQSIYLGGKGLNQAIALSNVLSDVYFYCNVNKDDSQIRNQLTQYNFNTKYIQFVNHPTGTAFIQVDKTGENAIVISKNANNKIDLHTLEDIVMNFEENDLVVVQNETNDLDKIINLCRKMNLIIALNPSPFDEKITLETLQKVHYLICNKKEFLTITKASDIETGLTTFRKTNTRTELVITLGDKGALHEYKVLTRVDSIKTKVVDTTCAGDTFLGFFLGSVLRNKPIDKSLEIANKAASLCIQKKGASTSIPTLQDILDV